MSNAVKNVAIVGAAGALGSALFTGLTASGKFKIRVLRREGSKSTYPPGTEVVDVNFDSVDSLARALAGQEALVSAMSGMALTLETNLIDASIKAGVKRFIPSTFGSDITNPMARQIFVFADKIKTQEYLDAKTKSSPLTYTAVANGPFLDWGLKFDFLAKLSDGKPTIIDGGNAVFSTTSLTTISDAVVGILTHLEETKNRQVYIEDIKLSQNKLLDLAKLAKPNKTWQIQHTTLDALTEVADKKVAAGEMTYESLAPYFYRAIMDPSAGGNFRTTDNKLLGIKGKTDNDMVEMIKELVP